MEKVALGLQNSSGDVIRGDLRFLNDEKKKPLVIVCHGFMAFKDWGFFPYIGERLAQAGFVCFVFNFSHNGVVDDGERITEYKRFEQNTITKELEDLDAVISHFVNNDFGYKGIDEQRIALVGHSRGGAVAILQSASDVRVKALVTLSAVSTFDRWTLRQKEQWRKERFLPLAKDGSVSSLRIGIRYLEDLEQNQRRFDIPFAASKIRIPWLLIHGEADVTVPPREAEILYQASNKATTEYVMLDKIGHLYNAASYEDDNYKTINYILDIIIHRLHTKL